MSPRQDTFDEAMFEIYRRAKSEAGYTASVFFNMVMKQGGLATAKFLINSKDASVGYTRLYERGRLDLTVEATILDNEKWHGLFTPDELERAAKRLQSYGYHPRSNPVSLKRSKS
jgi:hypothetical protein